MAKFAKHLQKDVNKLSNQLFGKNSLKIKKSFDVSTSFYSKKKEYEPYLTVSAHGNFSIPVAKLIVILLCAISAIMVVVLFAKGISKKLAQKKQRRLNEEYYLDNDDIMF